MSAQVAIVAGGGGELGRATAMALAAGAAWWWRSTGTSRDCLTSPAV